MRRLPVGGACAGPTGCSGGVSRPGEYRPDGLEGRGGSAWPLRPLITSKAPASTATVIGFALLSSGING